MEASLRLVGREAERSHLLRALRGAAEGTPSAVLVHGEAGIGKTTLVRHVEEAARADGFHVLFGQCLRFGAQVTSYVPFTQAVGHWLRTTPPETREGVLRGVSTVAQAVPALADHESGLALFQLASVLDALELDRPTLLVVDDLQWSDPSSLDVLAYVVAGFASSQRLAVMGTYRDTELPEGHRLHGWLADLVRMPFVEQLALERLDLWTVEQMVLRQGIASGAVLAEEVFRRSQGNPYLVDLLIADAVKGEVGAAGPGGGLGDVLAVAWHRLSPVARRMTQLVAVAGRPVAPSVLEALASRHGVSPPFGADAVDEAAWQGILTRASDGSLWFRHPLLAEVIGGTLPRSELAELHRDYANLWSSAVDVGERERATHLALHLVAAGEPDAAFRWSLNAADEAAGVRAREEEATHLSQAVALVASLSEVAREHVDMVQLLTRAARACEVVADFTGATDHYENALALVDPREDPLAASRILLKLHLVRDKAGRGAGRLSLAEPQQALELLEGLPACPERALALAQLAFAEVFSGIETALEHAEAAVGMSESIGEPQALIPALVARAQARWGTDEGILDAERAMRLAEAAGDIDLLPHATISLSNSYQSAGRYAAAAAVTETSYRALLDAGVHDEAAIVGSIATRWYIALGRWDRARPRVRELVSLARSDGAAGSARCMAAVLAALEGNGRAAALHLQRAEELMPLAAPIGDDLLETQVQVSTALGDPRRALELVEATMEEAVAIDPISADEFLEMAARAAMDLAEQGGHSAGDDRAQAMAALSRIESIRGQVPPPFVPAGERDVIHPALGALYAAQRAQCRGDRPALVPLWSAACSATGRADMRYEHARCHFHRARALLGARVDRRQVSESLTTARELAVELGALPLVRDVDALLAQVHLTVPTPRPGPTEPQRPDPDAEALLLGERFGAALTPREREVLRGLLDGETYAQIARRLVISQKTVSTHVSNVLRKTGTTSRVELALLARRTDGHLPPHADGS